MEETCVHSCFLHSQFNTLRKMPFVGHWLMQGFFCLLAVRSGNENGVFEFKKSLWLFPGQQNKTAGRTFLLIWQRQELLSQRAQRRQKEGGLGCVHTHIKYQKHTHSVRAESRREERRERVRGVERKERRTEKLREKGRGMTVLVLQSALILHTTGKPHQPFSRMSQRKRSFTFGAYGG